MLWCIAQDFTEKMWGQEEPTLFSSGLLSRFSQVGILISASSGTNFPLRAKRLSLSLSLSLSVFLLFSDMTTCRFLVKTEGEHVCLLYESEVVCGSQCVCVFVCALCACDGFTMCTVPVWDWMKSDMKETVRSRLPLETLIYYLLLLLLFILLLRHPGLYILSLTKYVIYNFNVTMFHLANVKQMEFFSTSISTFLCRCF